MRYFFMHRPDFEQCIEFGDGMLIPKVLRKRYRRFFDNEWVQVSVSVRIQKGRRCKSVAVPPL
jgi:hypothetical protein